MIIYVIRHGEADHNRRFRLDDDPKGRSNLTDKGRSQAQAASEKLAKVKLDAIFSSQLPRAIQTAEIIAKPHKLKLKLDPGLNEIRTGLHGQFIGKWLMLRLLSRDNLDKVYADGGESLNDALNRVQRFVDNLSQQPYEAVALVTHQQTIQALSAVLAQKDYRTTLRQPTGHAEIIEYKLNLVS